MNMRVVAVVLGIFLLDRISKMIVLSYFPDSIVYNSRGALGLMPWWVGPVGLAVLGWFLVFKYHNKKDLQYLILWAVWAGGLGNVIDRMFYNGVIDFVAISSFPVFNVADAVISCGAVVLIFRDYLFKKRSCCE